jgi:CRISPR-associated endonuclease cas1, DVULG subtype
MKKLLNTLYNTSANRYLSLDGLNVVVLEKNSEIGRVPLHNLESIVTMGYTGISPALMEACARQNISLCFLNQNGKFIARVIGETKGNVVLRKNQYIISENQLDSISISQNFIIGKLFNSKWVIERATRDYPLRVNVEKLKKISSLLKDSINKVRSSQSIDTLRGIEGEAASLYYSVFNELILQQKDDFVFCCRSRRPPMDNINALLSFAYVLLSNMCASALDTVGLDLYVGFMHTDRPGRASLALDIVEELRSVFADRFVITLINKKMINKNDFLKREDGAVLLTDSGRKTFIDAWQNRKKETIVHPFLNEKVEWGVVPYIQALLLARFIRGDIDQYPPFLWK